MSNEELCLLAKAGNKEAEEKLYIANMGLLYSECCAHNYFNAPIEDLMQEGYFALKKAIEAYDPKKEYKFTTFFSNSIKWHLIRKREQDKNKEDLPILDAPINFEKEAPALVELLEDETALENYDTLLDNMALSNVFPLVRQIFEEWYKANPGITEKRHYHTLETRFKYGKSFSEIGKEIGASYDEVKEIQTKALRKIRISLNKGAGRKLKDIFNDVLGSVIYQGGLKDFKYTHTSSVERAVIRKEMFENERGKHY